MLEKALDQITEADLDLLKSTGQAEGRTLDYKLTVHSDPWELRADVTALANTAGGHLILGVDEQGGVPHAIAGLPRDPDPDAVKLRIEQILGSNVEPRLPPIGMVEVPLANGNWCLVIRVPHSWAQPHAVVRDASRKFWARHSSGNFVMDVGQLRVAFTLSANVEARIKEFRIERLNLLQGASEDLTRVVFHLIPVSAFTTDSKFDLSIVQHTGRVMSELVRWGTGARYNLDGLLLRHTASDERVPDGNYAMFFRNGVVEAVESDRYRAEDTRPRRFDGFRYDPLLVESLRRLLSAQRALGVETPIFVLLTFMGVRGWSVWVDTFRYEVHEAHLIDRDILPLTPVMIDDYAAPPEEVLREALHELWQASGWPRSYSYDPDNNWAPRER